MSDAEELRFGPLTLRIDRLLCVGFEDCVTAAPALFRIGEDGIATFVVDAPAADEATLVAACRSCPVDALELRDGDGRVLAP